MGDLFDLRGNVAIVTGCSTGLGVQMANALARQGCNIVAVARRQNLIEEVAADLAEKYGVETLAVRCDITDTEMVENAVKTVMDRFGRIDILINNAGTGAVAPAEDITDDQFMNELNIDLFGTFKMARAVAKGAEAPLVMTVHTDYALYAFGRFHEAKPVRALMNAIGKRFYRNAAAVTIPSEKAIAAGPSQGYPALRLNCLRGILRHEARHARRKRPFYREKRIFHHDDLPSCLCLKKPRK